MTRALLEEGYRRFGRQGEAGAQLAEQAQAILRTRFDKQLAFIASKARRKAAFCTRRAGKTEADAAYLLSEALGGSERLILFVAKTRQRAKDLTWRAVEKLCEHHGVESKPHETLATRSFGNHSTIRWTGADDIEELKKKRGDKLWLVIVDEAQDFEFSILRALVDDIFGPALEDLGGTICLTGTPGIVCAGYWYNVTRPDVAARERSWEVFEWSVLDNPHMAHMRERLPQLKAERGWTDDNPVYLREWCGRWVNDTGALFYRFDVLRNTWDPSSPQLPGGSVRPVGSGWSHVLGWDLGLRDEQALVAWGFHPDSPKLYEAFSWKKAEALTDEVVAQIRALEAAGFNFIAMVADTGGLGALVVEEVNQRHGLAFEAAKKTDKAGHVELFNDELQCGRALLQRGSSYADEMAVLPKVAEWNEAVQKKPAPEDSRFANHCCDAGLYAWRRAFHWLHEKAPANAPAPGTPEAYALEEQRLIEEREGAAARRKSSDWWEAA